MLKPLYYNGGALPHDAKSSPELPRCSYKIGSPRHNNASLSCCLPACLKDLGGQEEDVAGVVGIEGDLDLLDALEEARGSRGDGVGDEAGCGDGAPAWVGVEGGGGQLAQVSTSIVEGSEGVGLGQEERVVGKGRVGGGGVGEAIGVDGQAQHRWGGLGTGDGEGALPGGGCGAPRWCRGEGVLEDALLDPRGVGPGEKSPADLDGLESGSGMGAWGGARQARRKGQGSSQPMC